MRSIVLVLAMLTLAAAGRVRGADAPAEDKDRQVRELQQQVRRLEARVAELEKTVRSLATTKGAAGTTEAAREDASRQRLVQKAHERMRQDLQTHTAEQLGEAEALYQVANQHFGSKESRESLRK